MISFIDIGRLKKAEQTVQAADLTTAIVNTIRQPLLVLYDKLSIITANTAFNQTFNIKNENLTGQSLFVINESVWDSTQLRSHLAETLTNSIAFDEYYYDAEFRDIGKKRLIINGRILEQSPGNPALILLAIEDVTGRSNL